MNDYDELLDLHWDIGREIVSKQKNAKWGDASLLGLSPLLYCRIVENGTGQSDNRYLICKDKDDVVAECALNDISQPIGIAEYELTKVLCEEFKSSLLKVEEIEDEK